ncbi:hypothetical protein B0H17DRAFT_1150444 [Mycena rosella]|uniref:Uncharacterized protein n=1 Tax=Mycena rosella TaxID=1033263 RepID=A0AAD7FNV4_MYCRO|nr:hypothetical protein B0H17DRAFT_1150444 [Mycena rosella]
MYAESSADSCRIKIGVFFFAVGGLFAFVPNDDQHQSTSHKADECGNWRGAEHSHSRKLTTMKCRLIIAHIFRIRTYAKRIKAGHWATETESECKTCLMLMVQGMTVTGMRAPRPVHREVMPRLRAMTPALIEFSVHLGNNVHSTGDVEVLAVGEARVMWEEYCCLHSHAHTGEACEARVERADGVERGEEVGGWWWRQGGEEEGRQREEGWDGRQGGLWNRRESVCIEEENSMSKGNKATERHRMGHIGITVRAVRQRHYAARDAPTLHVLDPQHPAGMPANMEHADNVPGVLCPCCSSPLERMPPPFAPVAVPSRMMYRVLALHGRVHEGELLSNTRSMLAAASSWRHPFVMRRHTESYKALAATLHATLSEACSVQRLCSAYPALGLRLRSTMDKRRESVEEGWCAPSSALQCCGWAASLAHRGRAMGIHGQQHMPIASREDMTRRASTGLPARAACNGEKMGVLWNFGTHEGGSTDLQSYVALLD